MYLNAGQAEEYARRHHEIWPEMVEMIHKFGGSDYAIFLDPDTNTLFASIQLADETLWSQTAEEAICRKW